MNKVAEKLRQYYIRFKEYEMGHRKLVRLWLFLAIFFLLFVYQIFFKAPSNFPVNKMVHVEKGLSLSEVSYELESREVIKSPFLFKAFVVISSFGQNVMAGDYLFSEEISVPRIAIRLVNGEFNLTPIKIVIPEGSTRKEMSEIIAKSVSTFDKEAFMKDTEGKEGYLFPDTYFFYPNATNREVISSLEDNFNKKIETLEDDIKKAGKSKKEIIIMASILEHEAAKSEDRKIISGILWKRIDISMPLQVDAPFVYYNNKGTYSLTTKDLKTDSPYNTYTRKGLPAGPIGNPGLDSILAAIYPKESPYLFYLSDREGNVYYSATFEKHKKNKVLYIN